MNGIAKELVGANKSKREGRGREGKREGERKEERRDI